MCVPFAHYSWGGEPQNPRSYVLLSRERSTVDPFQVLSWVWKPILEHNVLFLIPTAISIAEFCGIHPSGRYLQIRYIVDVVHKLREGLLRVLLV